MNICWLAMAMLNLWKPDMMKRTLLALTTALALSGCSMAPKYHVPQSAAPAAAFKGDAGWAPAMPADDVAKGQWWKLFGDPVLDALEEKVEVTNQNVAYYRAAYAQAEAVVRANRAALFPTISASASDTRSGTFAANSTGTTTGSGGSVTRTGTTISATGSASWTPDIWGKLADTTRQSKAQAQASAATLANATLSARGTLATNYFQLRGIDAQKAMLTDSVVAYRRSLEVTRNKLSAGTISEADVQSAQATLSNAEANLRDLERQRASYENAIAVLVGENPSTFRLAPAAWAPALPSVPGVMPGDILQRRPDIANAERLVAAANSAIGIQRSAFFPSITLSGSVGSNSTTMTNLFSAATSLWSLGASAAETLIDFGARSAKVAQARAAYNASVATYRQSVLNAFQEVETNLSAVSAYRAEAPHYAAANAAAARAETIIRNQYQAGTVDFTSVSSAQSTAYSARVNLIQNTVNQQTAAVALIQAIGGEWRDGVEMHPATK